MKTLAQYIRNTILVGLLFLIPLFVLLFVVQKVWMLFHQAGRDLVETLDLGPAAAAGGLIAAVILILLICFVFGLVAKWSIAAAMRNWFESNLKRVFPLYDYYRTLFEKNLDPADKAARPAVLVRRPGGWQPGIVVEKYASGEMVVFIPQSPRTTDGEIYLVGSDDVRPSALNEETLNAVLLRQGKGLISQ
jgi:uncharacterized membrane protein